MYDRNREMGICIINFPHVSNFHARSSFLLFCQLKGHDYWFKLWFLIWRVFLIDFLTHEVKLKLKFLITKSLKFFISVFQNYLWQMLGDFVLNFISGVFGWNEKVDDYNMTTERKKGGKINILINAHLRRQNATWWLYDHLLNFYFRNINPGEGHFRNDFLNYIKIFKHSQKIIISYKILNVSTLPLLDV
jgi:hypothetical protein